MHDLAIFLSIFNIWSNDDALIPNTGLIPTFSFEK